MSSGGPKYVPKKEQFDSSAHDPEYAANFDAVAETLERCQHSDDVALLTSTCRNHYLAVNAVFVDLRLAVGAAALPAPITRAVFELGRANWDRAAELASRVKEILAAAQAKIRVWNEKGRLDRELRESISQLSSVEQDRINAILLGHSLTTPADRYLALKLEDVPQLAGVWRVLQELTGQSLQIARMVDALVGVRQKHGQGELFGGESNPAAAWDVLAELIRSNPGKWGCTVVGQEVILITASGDRIRIVYEKTSSERALALLGPSLGERLRIAALKIASDLTDNFRPNVTRLPMPEPFVIDLEESSEARPSLPELSVTRYVASSDVLGTINVALVQCGIPTSWLDQDRFYQYRRSSSVEYVRLVKEVMRRALDLSSSKGANMIVFPENFVPHEAAGELEDEARRRGLAVVGGMEFEVKSGVVSNQAIVILSGQASAVHQRKQRPSVYEVWPHNFDGDGVIRIFDPTPFGVLGVMICSDYLEFDLLSCVATARPDLLVVVCRNPYPRIFERLAIADAARLYSHIVVVNSCPIGDDGADGKGTVVAVPQHDGLLELERIPLEVDWPLGEKPSVAFAALDATAIRTRFSRRQASGYLPSPRFVQGIIPQAV